MTPPETIQEEQSKNEEDAIKTVENEPHEKESLLKRKHRISTSSEKSENTKKVWDSEWLVFVQMLLDLDI